MGTIAAGQFKQRCLALIDEVAETQRELIITKRGRPMARLVPVVPDEDREQEILAALRARLRLPTDPDELLRPTSEVTTWRGGRFRT